MSGKEIIGSILGSTVRILGFANSLSEFDWVLGVADDKELGEI